MSETPRIAFIGTGNMAGSIIGGLLAQGYPANHITATARSEANQQRAQALGAITVTDDNHSAIKNSKVIVLSVKPQMFKDVVQEYASLLADKLIVSVAAGVTAASIASWIGQDCAVIRCMPNTPSQLRMGACGMFANPFCSAEQRAIADRIMSAVGLVVWCQEEEALHAVTAVSGSGPAYVFLFTQCMIEAGEAAGLDRAIAEQLAVQTVLGAATMASNTGLSVETLRHQVTSPNGVTERAIQSFEADDLAAIVNKAMQAAVSRSQEMSKLFS